MANRESAVAAKSLSLEPAPLAFFCPSMVDAPRYCRRAAYDLFVAQLSTLEETDSLVRAAVAVSMHELDDACPDAVDNTLAELATEINSRVKSGCPRALVTQLHEVLFEEWKFTGNTDDYYLPENSYLPCVLKNRRGLPVTLSLIYKSVAQRVGLKARGINSPAHFLAAVEIDGSWMMVDPFQQGRVLSREEVFARLEQLAGSPIAHSDELLATATHPQWLARIVRNLEQVFQRAGRTIDALAMRELLTLINE
jgi:regulator of sirC expression with transglutaminase-like and TPR domain